VKIAVLGRDRNILDLQQSRVRGAPTLTQALGEYSQFAMPTFLSYELLHLYGRQYLQRVEKDLEFPIDFSNPLINEIIKEDTNSKYFHPAGEHPTDTLAKHASRKKK
jgi:hypothetical protein